MKKKWKIRANFWEWYNNVKKCNVHKDGILGGKERETRAEEIFEEIVAKNFPKLRMATKQQIQEAQEYQVGYRANKPHLGIPYSNCRMSKTERKP